MTSPDNWWFCRDTSCLDPMGKFPGLRDETSVLQWLTGLPTGLSRKLEMRTILTAEFGSTGLIRMSDHMVLTQIARLLVARKLHIHRAKDPEGEPQVLPQGARTAPSSPGRATG
jgi:hypothetical protein